MATLQDTVDIELDGITPCLLSGKGCQGQVLLLRALRLHSFPLFPISAVTHLSEQHGAITGNYIAIADF